MSESTTLRGPVVRSYYVLSKALGLVALTLPFVLALGTILSSLFVNHALPHPVVERSISDYYYSGMRNYYEGSLCAIAAFLVCLRGYDPADEIAATVAGIAAFGVAMCPPVNPHIPCCTALEAHLGYVHSGFAAVMFSTLAYQCLFRFRKSSTLVKTTRAKRKRNRIYTVCGYVILLNMAAMTSFTVVRVWEGRHPSHWLFWFETLALFAFGFAWLTKGGAFMKDKTHDPGPRNGMRLRVLRRRKVTLA